MSLIVNLIELNLIAFIVVIHSSLLFCKADNCAFDASGALKLVPTNLLGVITKILALIPISLHNLQLLAHFFLICDAILILGIFWRLFGSIVRYVVVTIISTLIISFIVYLFTNSADIPALQEMKVYATDLWNKLQKGGELWSGQYFEISYVLTVDIEKSDLKQIKYHFTNILLVKWGITIPNASNGFKGAEI